MIHNGIIENYLTLKKFLISKGYEFRSETDTEVLVQLIEFMMNEHKLSLYDAVYQALTQVVGAYAIGVIEKCNPNLLITARTSSPLIVGLGEGEYFLGSDASPIVEYTKNVIYPEDRQVIKIERGQEIEIRSLDNEDLIKPEVKEIELSLDDIEKGGFPHFMLKEIFEQPKSLALCMNGRVQKEQKDVFVKQIEIANRCNLPISIHCRDAIEDCLKILKEHPVKKGGIMHCYAGSLESAKEFIKLGFALGFGGTTTFKNSVKPKDVAKNIDENWIVLETDSPYLTPVPFRGQPNHSKYLCYVRDEIASLRGVSKEKVEEFTDKNFKRIFSL